MRSRCSRPELSLGRLDDTVQDWIVSHRWGPLDGLFVALTKLGYGGAIWIIIAIGLALATRRPLVALLTAAAVWMTDLLAVAIKVPVDRPRPFITEPHPTPLFIGVRGDSFPSAHAATSFAAAVMLTSFFPRRWPVFFGLAVAIAFSRVYVGVHYPGDVLAGAALGVLVATALLTLVRAQQRRRQAPPAG